MHRILIIEDNLDIRDNLEEILELEGYEVISAENGAIGIDKALSEAPDLIVSDIAMPVKNGYEVFETLFDHLKSNQIPFIFLTASAQERDIARGRVSGADIYMTKPFITEDLLKNIASLLA